MPEVFRRFPERRTGKTDAEFLGYTVCFIKELKEERRCKTEGRRKKDEMVSHTGFYFFKGYKTLNQIVSSLYSKLVSLQSLSTKEIK
jgi:hypothetical protein